MGTAEAKKKAEEEKAEAKKKAEEEAAARLRENEVKKKAEEEAVGTIAYKEARKAERVLASLTAKIFGVTDVVVSKSQLLIESAKSMTGQQRKQAMAFVAATGFGAAFLV